MEIIELPGSKLLAIKNLTIIQIIITHETRMLIYNILSKIPNIKQYCLINKLIVFKNGHENNEQDVNPIIIHVNSYYENILQIYIVKYRGSCDSVELYTS